MLQGARATYLGAVCAGTRHFEAAKRETASIPESFAAARARQIRSLGDMPLIMLSAGQPALPAGRGISAADVEQMDVVQDELVALSTRGKPVIVQDCGHYIQVNQPELVVDAIREVVEAARR